MFDSVSFHDPVDDILSRARLQLICERGKAALGEGNNSVGDLVPGLFAERDLVDICVYLNDKVDIFLPPYDTAAQRAVLKERADFKNRDFWIWSREETHRYFLAGGGSGLGQTNLGIMYELGLGRLTKDEREAVRLYKLAADQGYATGQTYLGAMYERGLGGLAQDEREAMRLYKLAADQGNDEAKRSVERLTHPSPTKQRGAVKRAK
jgi:TPR repeat protein